MGLLENSIGLGYPQTTSTKLRIKQKLKQRAKQPIPLLVAVVLAAAILSTLYKLNGDNITSLSPTLTWSNQDQSPSIPGVVESDPSLNVDEFGGEDHDDDYDTGLEYGVDDYDNERFLDESDDKTDYRELFSATTRDRRYFPIFSDGANLVNPNIIPHPTQYDMWIIVARHEQDPGKQPLLEQLMCTAGLYEGTFICAEEPKAMEMSRSIIGNCAGENSYINQQPGPREARVFYGPDAPYIMYGSQSQFGCLGVWVQDVRPLLDVFQIHQFVGSQIFKNATEIQRPGFSHEMEKNFFIFWDDQGDVYAHYNLFPERSFAKLNLDGSAVEDLAYLAASKDQVCFARYMPYVPELETVQQATNSLTITLCKRDSPGCEPSDSNTFIMHIFHIKSEYDGHAVYEPYVVLFQRTAPFAIHAISQQPLWIHGREPLSIESGSIQYAGKTESEIPEGHTERFYITSMSWRTHAQKYHGYIDDLVFLSFGIEDSRPGAIDVLASDLLADLAFC